MMKITRFIPTDDIWKEIEKYKNCIVGPYISRQNLEEEFKLVLESDSDAFWDELSLKTIRRMENVIRIGRYETFICGGLREGDVGLLTEIRAYTKFMLLAYYYAGKRVFVLDYFFGGCDI